MVNVRLTMKLLLFIYLITGISTSAQSLVEREWKILQGINPPNGRHLYDSVFIDETEIANIHYLEYLFYIKRDSSLKFYQSQIPDSTSWLGFIATLDTVDAYKAQYFNYPGYRYFPVVSISYEQAINYCKWRTDAVNRNIGSEDLKKKYPKLKEYDYWFEFRLPTKEEWEFAATGGLDLDKNPIGYEINLNTGYLSKYVKDKACQECLNRNKVTAEKLRKADFNTLEDYYTSPLNTISCELIPSYMYEFKPNGLGLYNMIGNVAEMVAEKWVAKGGSFITPLTEISVKKDFNYNGPQHWLGFRCLSIKHIKRIYK
jgi:formylglycine-generating enzyme required for sulfatase activity